MLGGEEIINLSYESELWSVCYHPVRNPLASFSNRWAEIGAALRDCNWFSSNIRRNWLTSSWSRRSRKKSSSRGWWGDFFRRASPRRSDDVAQSVKSDLDERWKVLNWRWNLRLSSECEVISFHRLSASSSSSRLCELFPAAWLPSALSLCWVASSVSEWFSKAAIHSWKASSYRRCPSCGDQSFARVLTTQPF